MLAQNRPQTRFNDSFREHASSQSVGLGFKSSMLKTRISTILLRFQWKEKSINDFNDLSFTRDKYCHLTFCLHLMEPACLVAQCKLPVLITVTLGRLTSDNSEGYSLD